MAGVVKGLREIGIAVGTAGVLGFGALLVDWNTTDDEVKPSIEVLQELATQQAETTASLKRSVNNLARSEAQKTLRVTSRDMIVLEQKPRGEWTPADEKLYETIQAQQAEALEWLSDE